MTKPSRPPIFEPSVLALDPGVANTGYAYCEERCMTLGTITTSPNESLSDRFLKAGRVLWKFNPATVVIEEFNGHLGKTTNYLIGYLIGLFCRADIVLVPAGKWRKDLLGCGAGDKASAMLMKRTAGARTQHEADAVGILDWWEAHGKKYTKDFPKKVGV